jgi:hypothetical protein
MKPIKNITKALLLLIITGVLASCGGNDLGNFYSASVSFKDMDTKDILTIDIAQDQCDYVAAGTAHKIEDFYDATAEITVAVADGMPGLTINNYRIDYIPVGSEDGTHNVVTPPALNSITGQGLNLHIDTASTTTFTIPCFSTDQKEEYRSLIGWSQITVVAGATSQDVWYIPAGAAYPNLEVALYTFRITLHCTDDSGSDRDIVVMSTLYLGDYDNC